MSQVDVVMQLSLKLRDLVYKHFFTTAEQNEKFQMYFSQKSCPASYFPFYCGLRARRMKRLQINEVYSKFDKYGLELHYIKSREELNESIIMFCFVFF